MTYPVSVTCVLYILMEKASVHIESECYYLILDGLFCSCIICKVDWECTAF
jgi:hypothetical protein